MCPLGDGRRGAGPYRNRSWRGGRPVAGLLRRCLRAGLRARRGQREAGLATARGCPPGGLGHRHARFPRRAALRSGVLLRRGVLDCTGLRVLHISRQCARHRCRRGEDCLEDLYDCRGGEATQSNQTRQRKQWAFGRRDMDRAHAGCGTPRAVRHHGDNYSDPATLTSDAVLALNMDSGKLLWSKQLTAGDVYNSSCALPDKANCPDSDGPDFDFGASPMLASLPKGGRVLLLAQKSGMLYAVDPDKQGKLVWQSRVGKGGVLGGLQWGPASDGERVYVALSDITISRTRQPGTNEVARELDPTRGGGMFAFRVDNGERLWMTPAPGCGARRPCSPAQSAAVSAIAGEAFSGSVDGHLRAYSTADGKIIWDFDAARTFPTVNGVAAKGGAFDAAGAVIAGGMVFAGSGYGQWGGLPGNVLLAFSVEGR